MSVAEGRRQVSGARLIELVPGITVATAVLSARYVDPKNIDALENTLRRAGYRKDDAPAVFAATLAADVGGVFAAGAGPDKKGTLERLKALRRELFDPKIAEHHGRIVKSFAKCSPLKEPRRDCPCQGFSLPAMALSLPTQARNLGPSSSTRLLCRMVRRARGRLLP